MLERWSAAHLACRASRITLRVAPPPQEEWAEALGIEDEWARRMGASSNQVRTY